MPFLRFNGILVSFRGFLRFFFKIYIFFILNISMALSRFLGNLANSNGLKIFFFIILEVDILLRL